MIPRLLLLLAAVSPTLACGDEPVTTIGLIEEMIDFDRLCETPTHPYKTLQFTSTDRRSRTPGGPDWFANSDGFGGAPIPPFEKVLKAPGEDGVGEYLIADVEGPGAIVRTWTADINGRIRVEIDGADEPIFEGPAEQFLHRPYDSFAGQSGIAAATLQGAFYQRDAAYCPLPFGRRCRIVWIGDRNRVHFYYVQIRKYLSEEVVVEPFRPTDLSESKQRIEQVAAVLKDPDENHRLEGSGTHEIDVRLEPGERRQALLVEGPAALERLTLSVQADNEVDALRQTVMLVSFDGWTNAQVQSPVGDFFAAAPGINPFVSLPFTVRDDGRMTCRYVAPFKESARIEFHNRGDQPVRILGNARTRTRRWDDDRSMHFYARWRVLHDIATPPPFDVPFLMAMGRGRYVGTASLLMNTARGVHPSGTWWGEGDEKVYVDGDESPSWFGTGSEDYYNYAWSADDIFSFPFAGQPRNDGPANRGFVTNYRFHFLDDQPFNDRLAFTMELLSNHSVEGLSYACQAYHYGRPGMIDDHRPITSEDVRPPRLPAPWTPLAEFGSEDATFFEPEQLISDKAAQLASERGGLWSAGRLLTWRPTAVGDTLRLTFPVQEAAAYEVRVGLAVDARAGMVSAKLDDEPFGFGDPQEALRTAASRRTMLRASASDEVSLSQGDHELVLRYEGNGRGVEPFVGIDFLWLQPR
ncbi:hypothetical protein Pla123a_11430 [Posidoniimonas polymericola]|uniref:DUF2961 domain-containing protein n=1 Tax=Posidoniimonas polymericola TaxID=2528002 RepID=A0A5C5YTL4_9BACT|nr:glycoside hydrolase family 172 protein [Posidoniimonas polymericola]TWT78352.1 hypothetical protein Pla123a_11430 [Posidoniimonas polymericola]